MQNTFKENEERMEGMQSEVATISAKLEGVTVEVQKLVSKLETWQTNPSTEIRVLNDQADRCGHGRQTRVARTLLFPRGSRFHLSARPAANPVVIEAAPNSLPNVAGATSVK